MYAETNDSRILKEEKKDNEKNIITETEYFKKEISAQEIVDDAVNRPDITRYKSEDNTSAIVVTLPNYEKEKGDFHHGRR